MIFEVVLMLAVVVLSYVAVVYRRNWLAAVFVNTTSTTAPSTDTKLEDLLEIADRYYAEHNYLAAEKAYLKVLKLDHKNSLAYSRLGFVYSNLGNINDAIECFQIVADNYPNAASYHNLSMMYFKNREFEKSAAALEKSIGIEATASRLIALARIYRVMNKYEAQIETLQKALDLEPENISIMQLLAEAYLHAKDDKQAKLMFRKILKLEPNNMRARAAIEPPRRLKKVR
ncbi:tetratricopeptide repeat protein [Candidatus Saccharibacteria bacterium]|nr:tetratricopeptide repeat protein [Candidatus Saccharibacteria bacterium]